MTRNWLFFGLLISLMLLAAGIVFVSQGMYSDQLAARRKRWNPVSMYIKREIKTDLYKPSDGPAPLTGWEMRGTGMSDREGIMQTKISELPEVRKPAPAHSLQSVKHRQYPDSLSSVNRDSAATR